MHGFARPTIRKPEQDATAATPKRGGGNVVAIGLLQIQHSFGNVLLTRVYGRLSAHGRRGQKRIDSAEKRGFAGCRPGWVGPKARVCGCKLKGCVGRRET